MRFVGDSTLKCFGIFDAVLLAECATAAENELFDVISIGLYIIIAQQRKLLAAAGERHRLRAAQAPGAAVSRHDLDLADRFFEPCDDNGERLAMFCLPIGPDGRVSFLQARDIMAAGLGELCHGRA